MKKEFTVDQGHARRPRREFPEAAPSIRHGGRANGYGAVLPASPREGIHQWHLHPPFPPPTSPSSAATPTSRATPATTSAAPASSCATTSAPPSSSRPRTATTWSP